MAIISRIPRVGVSDETRRTLTVYQYSWQQGKGVNPSIGFYINGEDQGKDIYAYVAGHTDWPQGDDENRMIYKVRVGGLQNGDVISYDWDARNYTTIMILGTIVISDSITSLAGTTLKAAKTNGPSSTTYKAQMDDDGLELTMKLGTGQDDRCYIWLNNILVNGVRPIIVRQ